MKNSKTLRAMCLGAAVLMSISALSGCGNGGQSSTPSSSKDNSQADTPASSTVAATDSVYPIDTDESITIWEAMPLNNPQVANYSETEIAQELEKRTGIKVVYQHPASGMADEQFNMMLASNELPDIVAGSWTSYGGERAINENFILPLNDIIEKWGPNFKKNVCDNPFFDKMIKTDEGHYYVIPFLRNEASQCVFRGPIIRKDWLDELNLDVPETIGEWENMLQAFKDQKGAVAPLTFDFWFLFDGFLVGAYGVTDDYYVGDDGQVKFGPREAGYKDWLIKMNEWYEKGLLDQNFGAVNQSIIDEQILNDKTGATFGYVGGAIGGWLDAKADDSTFALVGSKYPVLNKGDRPQFGQRDWEFGGTGTFAISKQCKNPELAMRYLDYGYSEEGLLLYNYGIEGKTYEIKDGKPVYKEDFFHNNANGLTFDTLFSEYIPASVAAPTIQDKEVQRTQRIYPCQNEAVDNWSDTDADKHKLPTLSLSADETDAISSRITEIRTFADEMKFAFITGNKPISEFDEYVEQLKAMGVDEVIATYGVALERYNNR